MTLKQAGIILATAVLLASFFWLGTNVKDQKIVIPCKPKQPEHKPTITEEETTVIVNGVGLFDNTSNGEIVHIIITSKRGEGRVFADFSTGAYVGTDLQESILLARLVASEYTGELAFDKDYFVTFDSEATEVSGSSGTAGIAAGFVALAEGKRVKQNVAVSGFVYENQTIGEVERIGDKTRVAEKAGMTSMIIPAVQCNKTMMENFTIEVICAHDLSDVIDNLLE